jgi:purine nucleoside permease
MAAAIDTTPFITPKDMAKVVNAYAGEDRVRWSDEFQSFVTTDGTRYATGDIEDTCRGILRDREKATNGG